MNAKDRRLLITRFKEIVAKTDPQFLPFNGASPYVFPSHLYFSYERPGRGMLFLDLSINQKSDKSDFTLQFGWSRLGRFPEVLSVHYYMDDLAAGIRRYSQPEYMQRVMMFLGRDTWWCFDGSNPEQCEEVLKVVEDILRAKIIPYLVGALEHE